MVNRIAFAQKTALRKQNNISAGLVSERFPEVSGMVIHMTYYQKQVIPVLMVRTINVFPTSYAYFRMDCMMKGCEGGGFDLTSIIAGMVKARKKTEKGKIVCRGKAEALGSDHASIEYEITMQYNKQKTKKETVLIQ